MESNTSIRFARLGAVLGLCVSLLFSLPALSAPTPAGPAAPQVDFGSARASADSRYMGRWISDTADNQGLPFVIVDKKDARIYVFDSTGHLVGESAALLGLAPGDEGVPGIGKRELSRILPSERTTPAGRFLSLPGRNLHGEQVIWIDYNAGLAIHRVRTNNPKERRPERLASEAVDDNRISLGCVVVPLAFFENVVNAALGKTRAVVYVLPETKPVAALFNSQ